MTTNKDDNPPRRVHPPDRPGAQSQAHERQQAQRYRSGEDLNPRNDRGQGDETTQAQGRGNDPDRG
jgi:hypothetical protein